MKNIIENYIKDLQKKNLSKNTLEAYRRDVEKFSEFVRNREEKILSVDTVTIMAFVQYLQREGRATSSIVRNIVSIRNFYKYLIKKNMVSEDPTLGYEIPKIERTIPKILSVEEVDKLLNSPNSSKKGLRDKAMLELMYATGVKITELLNLNIYDINLKFNYIKCRGSKKRERIIPIGSYAIKCLKNYLEVRPAINVYNLDYLFLNLKGTQMTRQGFWKIIKFYAKKHL